ncbi:MAG: hypothetical protein AAGA30_00620 [Planctomycetota bacterium]
MPNSANISLIVVLIAGSFNSISVSQESKRFALPATERPTVGKFGQSNSAQIPVIEKPSAGDQTPAIPTLTKPSGVTPAKQFQSDFDAQPLPPISQNFNSTTPTANPRGQTVPFQDPNQNPLRELNAQKLNQVPSATTPYNQNPLVPAQSSRQLQPAVKSDLNVRPESPRIQNLQSPINRPRQAKRSILTTNIPSQANESSNVVPAGFSNPTPPQPMPPVNGPSSILDRYDVSASTHSLPGVPVSLIDLMKTTPIKYRLAMVQQYWETYFDWATLNNRRFYSNWLSQIQNPRTPADQLLLKTAKSSAQNEVMAAEIQLAKSQSKLKQLSRSQTDDLLPLPMNQPLVSSYNTHYDWYASRKMIPRKLEGINELIPRMHQLLKQRANTVSQSETSRNQIKQAFQTGQTPISNVLEAGRTWQSSLQGFVGNVVSYNQAISDYALTITPVKKPLDEIASMLVAKPKSVNEVAKRNSVLNRKNGTNVASTPPRVARQINPSNNLPSRNSNSTTNPNFNSGNFSSTNSGNNIGSSSNPASNRSFGNQENTPFSLTPSEIRKTNPPNNSTPQQPNAGGGGFNPPASNNSFQGGNFGG